MAKRNASNSKTPDETTTLRHQLEETEETLRAIRQYMVDAFVVTRENGLEVVTLTGGDFPYRLIVESMNEGVVTLIPDGTIFYSNPRFSQIVEVESEKLIGSAFSELLPAGQREHFHNLLRSAGRAGLRGEFCLQQRNQECVPVQLSFYQLQSDNAQGIAVIATDITERVQAEEKIRLLASELTIAEQEERRRISQVLHDDLQQRLFAMRAQLSFVLESFKSDTVPADIRDSLDQLQSSLSESITITRNLSVDISPVVLQGEGISEAIHWLSARMKEQHGLQLEIDIRDNFERLPDSIRVTLFQTVRELLFNIVKHAGVLHAKVTVEKLDGQGCITITDGGTGFDAQTVMADPQTAHGLMIIRDRLNLMGGTLQIESAAGKGTRARIEFPMENPSV
jgi:PAS domain S-box-containing protein